MPKANAKSHNMYYSFDYSYAHFISYSTETGFEGNDFLLVTPILKNILCNFIYW